MLSAGIFRNIATLFSCSITKSAKHRLRTPWSEKWGKKTASRKNKRSKKKKEKKKKALKKSFNVCGTIKLYLVVLCHSSSDMHLNHTFFVLLLFSSLNYLFIFFFIVVDWCEEKIALWRERNLTQWRDCSMIIFV